MHLCYSIIPSTNLQIFRLKKKKTFRRNRNLTVKRKSKHCYPIQPIFTKSVFSYKICKSPEISSSHSRECDEYYYPILPNFKLLSQFQHRFNVLYIFHWL